MDLQERRMSRESTPLSGAPVLGPSAVLLQPPVPILGPSAVLLQPPEHVRPSSHFTNTSQNTSLGSFSDILRHSGTVSRFP